ncbi:zinc finger, CCHC-type containing protein [Tanacetum coccineum]
MLVVRERGLRTNPKTKGDAIAWWIDFGATTHICKDRFGYYNNGIIHETTTPYTPQQNGVPERKNRALKEMVNFMLSYSGLKHSKAYRFYVIEPNDYVSFNSFIKSRDAIFDENHISSIPRPKDIIPNSVESQRDDHSDDVPSETYEPHKEAIDDEIGSIMENNTWVLSDLPPSCKLLGCKWIFMMKMKVDGTIDKFKARLVIRGFRQKEEINYFDTYAPVACIITIRLLMALAAIHNVVIHQMDVKTTFLNGDLDEKVYMKQPQGFGMPVSTPMDPVEKLKPNTGKPVNQLKYSRAIGCLMYAMTSTRPDIAYAVGRLSRFTSNPSRQHWQAITRVFKYLKDSSSTSGWVFLNGGGAILWAFKKQTCIIGSTMESEFVALVAAGKEVEWLRNLIHEIPIWLKPIALISIRCDSAPTMARAYSQIYNGKSRHLDVRHSMIRELIRNGVISIEFVRTQHNLTDHLTNGLARDLVIKSVIGMRLKSI